MNKEMTETSGALVAKIERLINRDTAQINDFLLCESRIYHRLLKERYARYHLPERTDHGDIFESLVN